MPAMHVPAQQQRHRERGPGDHQASVRGAQPPGDEHHDDRPDREQHRPAPGWIGTPWPVRPRGARTGRRDMTRSRAQRPAIGARRTICQRREPPTRGEKSHLEQKDPGHRDHAHRADVAVAHDLEHPVPGPRAEETVRGVGQPVHVKPARSRHQHEHRSRRWPGSGVSMWSMPKVIAAATAPITAPTTGKNTGAPRSPSSPPHQRCGDPHRSEEGQGGQKGGDQGLHDSGSPEDLGTRTGRAVRYRPRS